MAAGKPGFSMTAPLLTTKHLFPKNRADIVSRRQLIDSLNQSLSSQLTIVSAPAGFGKTTLIGNWIQGQKIPVAWLTLDENDKDPIRFLSYFLNSIQIIKPGFGETILDILQSPQALINEPLLTALVNEIASTNSGDFVIVLDDYHLADSTSINEIIAFVLHHIPPQMHMVLATRSDPSLPVALLRSREELLEIRQRDLRFRIEDAAEFLIQIKKLQLTSDQIAKLTARTEGWISGLQMAAISMQGRENIPEFIRSFTGSHRYISDYLIEEVLNHQPENVQEFLLRTSVLVRLSSDVCNFVMDRSDSQMILEQLEQANLFIRPLDEDRYWYRYHQLFADLLQKQLMQKWPELVQGLHRKASSWFDKEGFIEESIEHALETRDYEFTAQILEQNIPKMMGRGQRLSLIEKIFEKLPEEFIRSRPILSVQRLWGLTFSGRLDEAEEMFREIGRQPGIDENEDVAGHFALVRALIANIRGDMESAISLAHRAEALLPAEEVIGLGMILYILGNGYLEIGKLNEAERASEKIKQIGIGSNSLWTKTVAYHRLSQIKKLRGQLTEAQALCEELLHSAALRKAERYGYLCGIYFELGDIFRERNDLESARGYVNQGLELSETWEIPTDLVTGYVSLARICLGQADLEGATVAIRQAKNASEMGNIFKIVQTKMNICQIQLWIRQEKLTDVSRWANEIGARLGDPDPGKDYDFVREMELIGLARAWIAMGISQDRSSLEKANHLLTTLKIFAQEGQRFYRLIEILILQAIVLDLLGDEPMAIGVLEQCLRLAQPTGCLRLFLDEGQAMQRLLLKAQRLGINLPYSKTLLGAFEDQIRALPEAGSAAMPEPLSDREMEVLMLLPTKMTAAEMAEKLFIAKSTVDTHIKNIYSKLGVNRRLGAIQRAKELDLL